MEEGISTLGAAGGLFVQFFACKVILNNMFMNYFHYERRNQLKLLSSPGPHPQEKSLAII